MLAFAVFSSLTMSAHAEISGEELAKRQCRSVHMRHQEIPANSQAIYAEAVALKSSPGTYFCASNFNGGYIGFQEKADGNKWVIFSIWDPVARGDNPNAVPEEERTALIDKGSEVRTGRFGGEGTGGQSFRDYDWSIGEKMKFMVIRKDLNEKLKEISGYFFNNKTKKWELISKWKTHRIKDELSYSVSFVEDFRRNYESAKVARAAAYGPVFAYTSENKWVETREGKFSADGTPSPSIRAEIDKKLKAFVIQTGGDTKENPDFKLWEAKKLPEEVKSKEPGKDALSLILKATEKK